MFEQACAAAPARSQVEVNAVGRVIREIARQEGQPGSDLTLTIDMGLQAFIVAPPGRRGRLGVVIDVADTATCWRWSPRPATTPTSSTTASASEDCGRPC